MKPLFCTVSLVLLTSLISGCKPAPEPVAADPIRPVKLLKVDQNIQGAKRTFPAKIVANQEADLGFRIPGQVVTLPVLEGQSVKQGQLIAQLDDRDARNALLNREANYDLVSADFKRKTKLFQQKLISQAEFDTAKAELKSSKAALANAKDQLSYTQLKAPFSGTVAKRLINNHQVVQANQPVITLQKNSTVDVVIQVPEALVASIKDYDEDKARHAKISFDAKPQHQYDALLKEYSTEVTPGTQSYAVTFSLKQPEDLSVFPGMSAELTLDLVKDTPDAAAVLLPQAAISKRDSDNATIVWLYNDKTHTVHAQVVTIGAVHSQGIAVLSGVKMGDYVVTAGTQDLTENMKVKPLHWQRGV